MKIVQKLALGCEALAFRCLSALTRFHSIEWDARYLGKMKFREVIYV